jgi:hypothetical protein
VTDELFRTARDYHGALAAYCHAVRGGHELEGVAQRVVGTGLHYRAAIDQLMRRAGPGSREERISRRRLKALRSLLHFASRRYSVAKRRSPNGALPPD